jgi:DNA replication protein DnaC
MTLKFTIETLAEEQRTCEKHKRDYVSYLFSRADGTHSWSDCPVCNYVKEMAKRRQEDIQEQAAQKQRLITRLFKQSAIPPRFADDSFDNYIADTPEKQTVKRTMLEFAQDIKANLKLGRNVILAGNPGNGKTHLSVATAKAAINKSFTALFTTVGEMIDKIHEAGWNKATVIDNYAIPDLLILDEIAYTLNNEEQKTLFKVLNKRYEKVRSTIIQTNLPMPDLKKVLGERIIDRLRENNGIVLYFTWESFRK